MSVELEPIVVNAEVVALDEVVDVDISEQIVVEGRRVEVEPFETSENGTFTAPQGKAYSPVSVTVPQTEVVPLSVSENGTTEAPAGTAYNPVTVAVPIKTEESLTVEQNGTYTPETGKVYNRVVANVPNTYTVQDDGKVVSSGALVAQTARTVTQNGTVDTTLNNSVTVDVPSKTEDVLSATENGTYTPQTGYVYSSAVVNVPTRETDLQKLIDRTITSIEIPSGTTGIGGYTFWRCTSLSAVVFPQTVTSIGESAFYGCSALTNITFPTNLQTFGASTFYNCTRISAIIIPNNVTAIGAACFRGCSNVTELVIGRSVTSIGHSAFWGMTKSGLVVRFLSAAPPTVDNENAFTNWKSSTVIHVPSGSLNAYKTAANYPDSNIYSYVEDS